MGIGLSTSPDPARTINAVILLIYESGTFTILPIAEFIHRVNFYRGAVLAVIEPFTSATYDDTSVTCEKVEFKTVFSAVGEFSLGPDGFQDCRVWLRGSTPVTFPVLTEALRAIPVSTYFSSNVVSPVAIFDDFPGYTSFAQFPCIRPRPNPIAIPSPPPRPDPSWEASENDWDSVTPHLYVGSQTILDQPGLLKTAGITHVVCICAPGADPGQCLTDDSIQLLTVELADVPFESLDTEFIRPLKFVTEAIDAGGIVLAVCAAGISRSPSLCVAYLMDTHGWSYDTAFALVKSKRPKVAINPGFEKQLRGWPVKKTKTDDTDL
jgi:hypothetical protein